MKVAQVGFERSDYILPYDKIQENDKQLIKLAVIIDHIMNGEYIYKEIAQYETT